VLEAPSAAHALTLIDAHGDVDLVITDQVMPGVSGAELADNLRRRRPTLPIVIATGYAELPAGIARGLIRLAKPFSQGEVERAVSNAMRGSAAPCAKPCSEPDRQ